GGGLAGVACGWLLDGVADAVLFESRPSLGGHAHTIPVVVGNQTILVDVGAQFFSPGPHPTYSKLLEVIGLTKPSDPARDATLEAEMSITVMGAGTTTPRFVSPATNRSWPIFVSWNRDALIAFFLFAVAAREFTRDGDWLVPLETWLSALPVRQEQREGLLLPLVSAMVGCSIEQARSLSARSALVFVGEALPDNLLEPFVYRHSLVGLQGNVRFLAGISGNLTTHVGSPVAWVRRLPQGGFSIRNAAGVVENVDVVIFATPPFVTRLLLPSGPGRLKASLLLRQFEYFRTEISIHRDPVYMPQNPFLWSAYNPRVDGDFCEASVWYGALRPVEEGQLPLILFKSWATARRERPTQEIFRRGFLHPWITPDFIRTERLLAACQGQGGVWFAGSYSREVDSQETALLSAMSLVRELAPQAPNLLALES
ncbi:MAG: NAD(P)-binding protein, partial [Vicinamibacteria bacterium]